MMLILIFVGITLTLWAVFAHNNYIAYFKCPHHSRACEGDTCCCAAVHKKIRPFLSFCAWDVPPKSRKDVAVL